MSKVYDVAVIGSGPGGYVSALRLCQLGKKACVIDIDEARLGGICLNEGCIPVKSIVHSSKLFSLMKEAGDCGIDVLVKAPDMKKVVARSQAAVSQLKTGLKSLFKKYGVEFIAGRASMASRNKINLKLGDGKEKEIEAAKIIIATGSSPKAPLNTAVDGKRVLTSSEAIKLEKVPRTLLVIGAGAIGMEFASIFLSFGAKVTLVEMMPGILPFTDEDVSKALIRSLKKRGISILVNTKVKALNKRGDFLEAVLETDGAEKKMEFEYALTAIGRAPNTGGIGLEKAGVKLKNGFIAVDDRMRTNIDSIYAVGDVVDTPMYAHVAYKEGIIAAEDIAGIKRETIDYESVPNVFFSEPQIASVGLTESLARKKGRDIAVSRHFFKANGMAVITRRDEGFIKVIADAKTRQIVGAHIIGGDAGEIIHEFVLAKNSKLTADDITNAVHAHPTFSETAVGAAKGLFAKPIHG